MNEIAKGKAELSRLEPGIHGWLLFFILWLGVISPVFWIGFNFVVFARLEAMNPADAELMREMGWDVVLWVVTLTRECMRIVVALILYFYRRPVAVWIAFAVLWLAGPLLIVGTWSAVEAADYNVAALIRSALWAFGWSLYLFMSRRVRLTYGFRASA